jgi:hypothetical protein
MNIYPNNKPRAVMDIIQALKYHYNPIADAAVFDAVKFMENYVATESLLDRAENVLNQARCITKSIDSVLAELTAQKG